MHQHSVLCTPQLNVSSIHSCVGSSHIQVQISLPQGSGPVEELEELGTELEGIEELDGLDELGFEELLGLLELGELDELGLLLEGIEELGELLGELLGLLELGEELGEEEGELLGEEEGELLGLLLGEELEELLGSGQQLQSPVCGPNHPIILLPYQEDMELELPNTFLLDKYSNLYVQFLIHIKLILDHRLLLLQSEFQT